MTHCPEKLVYATAGSSTDTRGPDSLSSKCVSGFFKAGYLLNFNHFQLYNFSKFIFHQQNKEET